MAISHNPAIYRLIANELKSGVDFHDALVWVEESGFGSKEEVRIAGEAIRADLDRVYNFRDPAALIDEKGAGFYRWYVGPSASSTNWNSLRERLRAEGRTDQDLDGIEKSSTRVVSLLPSPTASKAEGRGLVMGYVQSGKTTNFMSVAAKCADEGYRLIVILSGVTNNLRNQTQNRVHSALSSGGDLHWHWLTQENIDFIPTPNAANTLSTVSNRSVMVIKKNAGRLQKLIDWLNTVPPEIRALVPMLIIDDEADQASVNTAKGRARRSAINDRLLRLMSTNFMPVHAYVGYTATPFANFLIDPNDENGERDLFPRDFIVSLPKGDGYFGAEQLFGRDAFNDDDEYIEDDGLNLIREISKDDIILLGKSASVKGATTSVAPKSLKESIRWFFLATAARRLRSGENQWSTMLIHASGRLAAHNEMKIIVEKYVSELQNMPRVQLEAMLETQWNIEQDALAGQLIPSAEIELSDLVNATIELVLKAKVLVDNSRSQDRIDYDYAKEGAEPERPILVIGGNTLARGLTLEGLISSYFLRTSNAYDSLLQMGRWFGYRPGYEDLQRIWMPPSLASWFRDLATVEAEIRDQIEQYSSDEVTPLRVPVLIRTHPAMMVTSAAKSYDAVQRRIGLSTQRIETVFFESKNESWLDSNLVAGNNFLDAIGENGISFEIGMRGTNVARGVPADLVKAFLDEYSFHQDSRFATKDIITDYINKVQENGELNFWNIMLMTKARVNSGSNMYQYSNGISVAKLTRTPLNEPELERANIKALAGSADAALDVPLVLSDEYPNMSSNPKPTKDDYIKLREKAGYEKTGLLGLYIIDKDSDSNTKTRVALEAPLDLLGLTFFFPKSRMADAAVSYLAPRPYVGIDEPEIEEDDGEDLFSADENDEEQVV
jgi:hypothetical protein